MLSVKSLVGEKWLVVDTATTYSSSYTVPAGGWTSGQNDVNTLILTDKPSDTDGYNAASFKPVSAASGDEAYQSLLMNGETDKYLRDWWDIANCNAAQTGNDAKYSSVKFVEVTE